MDEKKKEYEAEIGRILRKTMEVSYLRKKNTEKITQLLQAVRNEPATPPSSASLLDEYSQLRSRVARNLGGEE